MGRLRRGEFQKLRRSNECAALAKPSERYNSSESVSKQEIPVNMNDHGRIEKLQQMAFEVWKFQIEAFWTRTSYFALFELAFAAGVWKTFDSHHWITSAGISVGALSLTIVWIANNSRLHEYIVYYGERLKHYEAVLEITREDTIFTRFDDNRCKRFPGRYHLYIQAVPIFFTAAWVYMLVWSVSELHDCLAKTIWR